MHIIKVNATKSTNSLAREWHQSNKGAAATCITAFEQSAGRGQRGAGWSSNAGENLTFSVVFPVPEIAITHQFMLSVGAGLAVLETLSELGIRNLKLKWPNDIMAANFKIGGILIENILSGNRIGASIIGIGLNVNQLVFPGLPKASSLRSLSGRQWDTDVVLKAILENLESKIIGLQNEQREELLSDYENVLFRKGKASTFELPDQSLLTGIISGVAKQGLLKIQVEDGVVKEFDLKEIKLLF